MKIDIKKTYSRNCFLIQFHILCANFRKNWKKKQFATAPVTIIYTVGGINISPNNRFVYLRANAYIHTYMFVT